MALENLQKQLNKQVQELIDKGLGKNPYFISDTSAHTGLTSYAVKAIEDTIIDAIVSDVRGNTLVGETILAGDIWYLKASSITLTSGALFVYNLEQVES